MKVSELHSAFIEELSALLPEWKFVASKRHFRKKQGEASLLLHIAFVNHESDFDAVANVAIEFLADTKRVAAIGAQLGNIAGIGQTRHLVCSLSSAKESAYSLAAEFEQIGIPFFERYSNPAVVVEVLEAGGQEAQLISPILQSHASQVAALRELAVPPNKSLKDAL